jgi:hypothetical protein
MVLQLLSLVKGLVRILKPAEMEIGAHGEMGRIQFVAGSLGQIVLIGNRYAVS